MEHANARATIGWGIYTASSWTWCIGLFLPIIMIRLFGWPGFLLFAVPNIAGVVAFGYLFDRSRCLRALRENRTAIRLFSIATAGYQFFFIAWLWSFLAPGGSPVAGALVALAAWLLGLLLSATPDRGWVWMGVGTWIVSMALLLMHGLVPLASVPSTGSLSPTDLALLAPAVIFGFLLCPWLDATFHRARLRSRSPRTFLVFAAAFAPMILFTCLYGRSGSLALDTMVLVQLTMQATFTGSLHLREGWLGGPEADRDAVRPWPMAALLPGAAILLGTVPFLAGEATYLRILGLYGLVFPAYALFFMSPWGRATPNRTTLLLFALLMLPCGLAFDRAFVPLETAWVIPAVGGLLLIGVAIRAASGASVRA